MFPITSTSWPWPSSSEESASICRFICFWCCLQTSAARSSSSFVACSLFNDTDIHINIERFIFKKSFEIHSSKWMCLHHIIHLLIFLFLRNLHIKITLKNNFVLYTLVSIIFTIDYLWPIVHDHMRGAFDHHPFPLFLFHLLFLFLNLIPFKVLFPLVHQIILPKAHQ